MQWKKDEEELLSVSNFETDNTHDEEGDGDEFPDIDMVSKERDTDDEGAYGTNACPNSVGSADWNVTLCHPEEKSADCHANDGHSNP